MTAGLLNKKKFALVTAGCSEPALKLARQFAGEQCNLVLVGENKSILEERCRALSQEFGVQAIPMVKALGVVSAALETYNDIKDSGIEIDYLVNIAEAGEAGSFVMSYSELDTDFLQRNIISFVSFTKYFLRDMVKRNKGTIYHIPPSPASTALATGTTQFILSFTTAVAREVMDTNISIMSWCYQSNKPRRIKITKKPETGTAVFDLL